MNLAKLGAALQGFGAGVQGQGPQFIQALNNRQETLQDMEERRRQALLEDFRMTRLALEDGDVPAAMSRLQSRLDTLSQIGGDPTHTGHIARLVSEGRTSQAADEIKAFEDRAVRAGLLDPIGGETKYQFGPGNVFKGPDGKLYMGTQQRNPTTGGVETVVSPLPDGLQMVGTLGLTAEEQIAQRGSEAAASTKGELLTRQQLEPDLKADIRGAETKADLIAQAGLKPDVEAKVRDAVLKVETASNIKEEKRSNERALRAYELGSTALVKALGETVTGPIAGLVPAFTSSQQTADAAVAALKPLLKAVFRQKGEGTWTDADQRGLDMLAPTRSDTPETRIAKANNLDLIVRTKLGDPIFEKISVEDLVYTAEQEGLSIPEVIEAIKRKQRQQGN